MLLFDIEEVSLPKKLCYTWIIRCRIESPYIGYPDALCSTRKNRNWFKRKGSLGKPNAAFSFAPTSILSFTISHIGDVIHKYPKTTIPNTMIAVVIIPATFFFFVNAIAVIIISSTYTIANQAVNHIYISSVNPDFEHSIPRLFVSIPYAQQQSVSDLEQMISR